MAAGTALELIAASLAIAGAMCGLAAAGRPTARDWIVHMLAAAAMVWMVLPADIGAVVGRHVWSAALLAAMLWTVVSQIRRHRMGSRRVAAARQVADLAATAILVVLLPAAHHTAPGPVWHGHDSGPAVTPLAATVIVLVGWAAIVVVCSILNHRESASRRATALGTSSAGLMVVGMAVMTGMSATG